MLKENILKRLVDMDNEIYYTYGNKHSFQFVIVGGSALILNCDSTRGTPDIDVVDLIQNIINIASKYDMNCRVNAYVFNFPYNYEDRLVPVKGNDFKVCKFFTPSLEDLVVSKIAASRAKDIEDLNSSYILNKLDWKKLIKIVEVDKEYEMANVSSNAVNDFMFKYNKYKKEHYKS
ncbi:MAG: DUF6036 family nucleotidyltransferase [Bacilli bacterium]|nr:DUF6036 family nucleotidyltransferase [Bacilli bacterium]